jgi:hypothetical protein
MNGPWLTISIAFLLLHRPHDMTIIFDNPQGLLLTFYFFIAYNYHKKIMEIKLPIPQFGEYDFVDVHKPISN